MTPNYPVAAHPDPTLVGVTVLAAGGAEAGQMACRRVAATGVELVASAGMLARATGPHQIVTVADVAKRTPGCGCCQVRLDLVESVARLSCRRTPPARIVVGVGEHDDVATAVRTILSDPELSRRVRLDGVLVAVDGVALATRLAVGAPFGDRSLLDRLAMADRVVVARSDDLTGEASERLVVALRAISRFAVVTPMRSGVETLRVGLGGWYGAPVVQPSVERRSLDLDDHESVVPDHVVVEQPGLLDPDGVDEWLDGVLAGHASRLLRLQGAFAVEGRPTRICCHGVRSFVGVHPEHGCAAGRRRVHSLLAMAGVGLDADELATSIEAVRVR